MKRNLFTVLILLNFISPVFAEEGDVLPQKADASLEEVEKKEVQPISQPNSQTKKKGKRGETASKETEGTKARDRFEGNTILKSQYSLDGQPLEVDPD